MTTPTAPTKPEAVRLRLFTSYPHRSDPRLGPLWERLDILKRNGYIEPWRDRTGITAGEPWEPRIRTAMARADIILVVYSVAARDSKCMQEVELPFALERARREECRLIVVPLDWKDWDPESPVEQELKDGQMATWNGKPVLDFRPQRKGWDEVHVSIREAVVKWRVAMGRVTRGASAG